MNLTSLVTTLMATQELKHLGPRLARRALAYGLLALAVVCLMVVVWRVLELALGPLLGPLVAAGALALASALLFYRLDHAKPQRPSPETLSLVTIAAPVAATVAAPLLLPVLKYVLHPKRAALLAAFGSLAYAVGALGKSSGARSDPPHRHSSRR